MLSTDWLLCWRFRMSATENKRVITAHIFMIDKKHTILSPIPKELARHSKLFMPQVFDTFSEADGRSREVMKKIGFRYFE